MKKFLLISLSFLLLVGCVSSKEDEKTKGKIMASGIGENPDSGQVIAPLQTVQVKNFLFYLDQQEANDVMKIEEDVNYIQAIIPPLVESQDLHYQNNKILLEEKQNYQFSFWVESDQIQSGKVFLYNEYQEILLEQDIQVSNSLSQIVMNYHHDATLTIGKVEIVFSLPKDEGSMSITTVKIQDFKISRAVPKLTVSVNQVGYLPESQKIAVFNEYAGDYFEVIKSDSKEVVYRGNLYNAAYLEETGEVNLFGDFSSVKEEGMYLIRSQFGNESYSFEIKKDAYDSLLIDTLKMITLQRCGEDLLEEYSHGFDHLSCHKALAIIYSTMYQEEPTRIDVSGGWHDAGDYGRYVPTATKTINDLLFAYYMYPDLFTDQFNSQDSGNDVPDILDEALIGLTWLEKMQIDWGPVYNAVVTPNFPGDIAPEEDHQPLYVLPEENSATAATAASFAMASIVLRESDPSRADFYLEAAKKSYEYAILVKGSGDTRNPEEIIAGDYRNNSDLDEIYYAASALYVATHDEKYLSEIEAYLTGNDSSLAVFNYDNVTGYGSYLLLQDEDFKEKRPDLYQQIYDNFFGHVSIVLNTGETSPMRTAIFSYIWGGNTHVANDGILLLMAYELTGNNRYYDAAQEQLSYLLGKNRLQQSFVVGYGSKFPVNPHHRPSRSYNSLLIGALVGGPDGSAEGNQPVALKYYDQYSSYNTNEVAIYFNSALLFLVAGIADK